MAYKLTPVQKAKARMLYGRNESRNAHRENNEMLIAMFGTKADNTKAIKIRALHKKQGSLTMEQSNWMYEHGSKKHYRKLK